MKKIAAFFTGMYEFRLTYTLGYASSTLTRLYDLGRETAHRLTFRIFEP